MIENIKFNLNSIQSIRKENLNNLDKSKKNISESMSKCQVK